MVHVGCLLWFFIVKKGANIIFSFVWISWLCHQGSFWIVRKLHYVFSHCVCMLFLFGWPPCQRSDMTLIEVSQRALHSLYMRLYGYCILLCFFVNLIWYLYLFWLNKHCPSLSLSLDMGSDNIGLVHKNTERHTAHTIVSWPNPKQWVIVRTSDLVMIIRQSIYIQSSQGKWLNWKHTAPRIV